MGALMGDLMGEGFWQLLFLQRQAMGYPQHSAYVNVQLIQYQNNIVVEHMNQQTSLPPFSLYNIGKNYSKSCYESQALTIISTLNGPYFDRNRVTTQPTFNCTITGSGLEHQQVASLCCKLKEIVGLNVVQTKYARMNFDLAFQVVEIGDHDGLISALVNLLCFSLMLAGVEIKSVFSCAQAYLTDDGISWQKICPPRADTKKMCLALESSQKQIVYSCLEGEFVFVHFQRLSNILMDANEQIQAYIIRKIWELNDECQK